MKNFFIILSVSFLLTFSAKANPWLVIEGIGIGVQILEAGANKLKDVSKKRKSKKKQKQEANKLKESSKIITFSQCTGLQPNYLPETIFKIDVDNKYIKIDQGEKNKLIYFRVNNIQNSKVIAIEAFSPNKKDQKKIEELYKYIGFLLTFDVVSNSADIKMFIEGNAPKKIKKKFSNNIKKGKLSLNTNANCHVSGSKFLIKKKEEQSIATAQNNKAAQWVAIVKHKKKNTKYTSDNKIEINTKEKAINNAKSKCWFDPKHIVGDWPYSNCRVVSVESTNSSNVSKTNKYPWNAESKHPKSTEIFRATNLSTKKKAVNLVMKKCYLFVTKTLGKVGYNDCSLINVYSKNLISVEEEVEREKEAIDRTILRTNEQWMAQNKQDYIDTFNKKLNEYEIIIRKLKKKRNVINTKVLDIEKLYLDTTEEVENSIEDTENVSNKEIKQLLSIIKENKKLHLSNSNLEYYKDKLKDFNKVKFNDYVRYKTLESLIKKAKKSNKVKDFVGKSGYEITLPKIAGGGKIKLTSNKTGFIQEFKNIKNKDLGYTFKLDQKNFDQLLKDIDNNTQSINNLILRLINDLKILDEEISHRNFYLNFLKQNLFFKFFQLLNTFVEMLK